MRLEEKGKQRQGIKNRMVRMVGDENSDKGAERIQKKKPGFNTAEKDVFQIHGGAHQSQAGVSQHLGGAFPRLEDDIHQLF